jgi:hypothetical protein
VPLDSRLLLPFSPRTGSWRIAVARLLVCLPVCLLLAPSYPGTPGEPPRESPELRARAEQLELLRTEGYPPSRQIEVLRLADLAARDPVGFFGKCLEHYDRHIQGYTLTLHKQERLGGQLHEVEQIAVAFKDSPHSVFFNWLEGFRKARRVLYVEGQNENRMLAKAHLPPLDPIVVRELDSPDAKASGRYSMADFGLRKAMERVHRNWKKAQDAGALHVEYLGLHKVPKAGNRLCHALRRTRFASPEDDGVTELLLYIDVEDLLQVGSVLRGLAPDKDGQQKDGQFLAEYFFRDIRLNPTFPPEQFTRAALTAR